MPLFVLSFHLFKVKVASKEVSIWLTAEALSCSVTNDPTGHNRTVGVIECQEGDCPVNATCDQDVTLACKGCDSWWLSPRVCSGVSAISGDMCQESSVKSSQVLASQGQSSLLTNYLIKSLSNTPCLYSKTLACCIVGKGQKGGAQNDHVMLHWTQNTTVNLKMPKTAQRLPTLF